MIMEIDKNFIRKIVYNQILNEIGLNLIKVQEEYTKLGQLLIDNNNDQWDNVIQLIYQRYPFVKGDIMAQQFIFGVLISIKMTRIENWDVEDINDLADLISDIVVRFFAKYDDICTRAQAKRGQGLH